MFYSNGDVCDETGKPRQVEVKLKYVSITTTQHFLGSRISYIDSPFATTDNLDPYAV